MTRSLPLAAAALAALALPAGAFAQGVPADTTTDVRATVKAEREAEMTTYDTNKDGKLSKEEIAAQLAKDVETQLAALRAERDAAFGKFDSDKNGAISKAEFEAGFKLPEPKPVDGSKFLAAYDMNKDGAISTEEYLGPVLARFDRFDKNKDGKLTPAEKSAKPAAARPSKGSAAAVGR